MQENNFSILKINLILFTLDNIYLFKKNILLVYIIYFQIRLTQSLMVISCFQLWNFSVGATYLYLIAIIYIRQFSKINIRFPTVFYVSKILKTIFNILKYNFFPNKNKFNFILYDGFPKGYKKRKIYQFRVMFRFLN